MELTIQSLGFLIWIQEDIKTPRPMEELTIQSLGFLIGFQEDIKIPWPEPQSLAVILDWSSLKALNG